MTTNMDPSKYTLIYYRPNGERYEGCGDYTRFDSELECFVGVSREEMLQTIVSKTKHASSCCGSCPQSETACEFAILKDGKPLLSKGSNLSSFYEDGVDETDAYYAVNNIFDEAAEVIEQEHKAAAEAEAKAKAEAAAKKLVADAEAARARQKAAEEAERRQYETLRAKFEPKLEPVPEPLVKAVEKAKAEWEDFKITKVWEPKSLNEGRT